MARQNISLNATRNRANTFVGFRPNGPTSIDSDLLDGSSANELISINFYSDGSFDAHFDRDLSSLWETSGSLIFRQGSTTITLQPSTVPDTSQPYVWPAGTVNYSSIVEAAAELTLDDGRAVATYPTPYWAELVRSSSSTSLSPSRFGGSVWLRTSDGEPLEQEFAARSFPNRFFAQTGDENEPDYIAENSAGGGGLDGFIRFRKTGAAWIPSDAGIDWPPRSSDWDANGVWRFYEQLPPAVSVPGAILIGGVRVVPHDHTGKRLFVHIGDRLIYAPPSLAIAPLWNDDTGDPISAVVGTVIDPITVPAVDAGSPAPAYTASGLPAGLAFDPATRIISGTPLGLAITGTAGTAITPVTLPQATGSPAPAYTVSGLPAGLAFDPNTRTISGTPSAAGTGTITMTATNAAGTATYERDYAFGSG